MAAPLFIDESLSENQMAVQASGLTFFEDEPLLLDVHIPLCFCKVNKAHYAASFTQGRTLPSHNVPLVFSPIIKAEMRRQALK
jgi:hypothetical protein